MQYHQRSNINALLFYHQIVALLLLNHPLTPDYDFKILVKTAPCFGAHHFGPTTIKYTDWLYLNFWSGVKI